MPQIICIADDGSLIDVTDEVGQLMDENSEMFEELEEVQLSHPELTLARKGAAQTTGSAPDVTAASKPKGRLAARTAGPGAATAAKAAGKPLAAKPITGGASLAGGARPTTLGKKVGHAAKLVGRLAKKHPAAAAAAGAFAGAGAANALRSKMKLSNDTSLQLDEGTELLEETELQEGEFFLEDLSPEQQDEYIESLTDEQAQELFASLPEDEQEAAIEEARAERLNQFAAGVLSSDAEGRTPKKK